MMREFQQFVEHVDYTYVIDNTVKQESNIKIRLETGKYKGVVFRFGKVTVDPDINPEVDDVYLNFEFTIIESGDFPKGELSESEEFKNCIGDLLVSIIIAKDPDLDENLGTDDTEEFDSE